MTASSLQALSQKFGLNNMLVESWFLQGYFSDINSGIKFFNENIEIIKAKPFVKWAGGKGQILQKLIELLPKEFNNYFEPFIGGGALFFSLQRKKSFLSDINEELINAYCVIKSNPIELINFLENCKYEKDFYDKIRIWDREKNWEIKYNQIQRAGRFLYLNRTCYNGLYRVNKKGQFNVPMGKYKNPDFIQRENIINVSKLLNKTQADIKLQSYEKVLDIAKAGDFVYFDPPYDTLTDTANFTAYNENGFNKKDQENLSNIFKALDKKGVKVMLSNHNTPYIRSLYSGYKFEIIKAKRNINSKASNRGYIEEIVIMNY